MGSNPSSAGTGGGGNIDLSGIIAQGAKAAAERRRKAHIDKIVPMVMAHDCAGAEDYALKEKDPELAQQVHAICLTKDQAGEEPIYVSEKAGDGEVIAWARANLHLPADAVPLSADHTLAQYRLSTKAQPNAIWVRTEALAATGEKRLTGRSNVAMIQFDCTGQRYSVLAMTTYAGQNLTGRSVSNDRPTDPTYWRPGTLFELWSHSVCGQPGAAPEAIKANGG
jgi:hypothetical protein